MTLSRYRRKAHEVDAILFDGTPAAAAEVSGAFGGFVSDHGGTIEVRTGYGRVWVGAGCWVVRCCETRSLEVVDDREFVAHYELLGPDDCAPLDRRSFARSPDPRWDVV